MNDNKKSLIFSLLTFAVIGLNSALYAQEADFFDLPLPGPATLQTIDFKNVDFPPLPTLGSENRSGSDSAVLYSHIESLVDIALQSRERNPQRWGNFSGFPERRTCISLYL